MTNSSLRVRLVTVIVSTAMTGVLSTPALSAGALVESREIERGESAAGGISYYLPMRLFKLRYERFKPDDDLKSAVEKAKTKAAEKTAALADATKTLNKAESVLTQLREAEAAIDSRDLQAATLAVANAKVDVLIATAELESSKAALSKAEAALDEANRATNLCGYVDRFTISLTPYVADTSKRYVARLTHRASRDDKLTLGTTRSGLLSTVRGSADDQTSAIIASLASAVGAGRATAKIQTNYVRPQGKPDPSRALTPEEQGKICAAARRRDFEMTLAPNNTAADSLTDLNDYIKNEASAFNQRACKALGKELSTDTKSCALRDRPDVPVSLGDYYEAERKFTLTSTHYLPSPAPGTLEDPALEKRLANLEQRVRALEEREARRAAKKSGSSGLYYRREIPIGVAIKENGVSIAHFSFEIPNFAPADRLEMDASWFVKSDYTIGFENGMLVSYDATRPSEAAKIASLPFTVAKELLKAPAEILSLKVDLKTNSNSLVDAETQRLERLLKLLEAQQKLTDAEKNADP